MGVHDAGDFVTTIIRNPNWSLVSTLFIAIGISSIFAAYIFLRIVAHFPRPEVESERYYTTATANGPSERRLLPSAQSQHDKQDLVCMSVVVPAYNEEDRILIMLEETVGVLNEHFAETKWEILIVDDGSSDKTTEKALKWAQKLVEEKTIREGDIRVCRLARNRGKGGAVTHGMRHIRGQYAIFADADGATQFLDVLALQSAVKPSSIASIGIGSRAHMVNTAAVVKRSFVRNFLMHGFHLFVRALGPRYVIHDTQCGFKMFTREAVDAIFPQMHCEGWIFDIEILLLAERLGFGMKEVAVTWHEVEGTKMNLIKDSIKMAWDLMVLRGAYAMGVYGAR